jgi:hypothetical protein
MMILMAVTGTLIISATAPPAVFYILSVFTVLFVLSGYWIGYTGKLKYPLMGLIFIYAALSILFPMLGINPQNKAAFNMSLNDMRIGIMPQNIPDRHNYRVDELVADLAKAKQKIDSQVENPVDRQPVPLGIYFDERMKRERPADWGYLEREAIPCIMDYNNMNEFFRFYIDGDRDWERRFNELSDRDMLLVVGYTDESNLSALKAKIKDEYGLNTEEISSYNVDGIRRMKILLIKKASLLP